MKFKKLLVLIAVLAVIAGLSFAKKAGLEKDRVSDKGRALSQTEPLLGKGFSSGFVTKMDVYRGKDAAERLLFVKDKSGVWLLQNEDNAHAKKDAVESLLKSVAELKGELRSEDEAVLGDYSLKDEQAYHFQFFGTDGTELGHVLLSPLRPRGTQNFVRLAKSKKVLVTDTDILGSLGIFSPQSQLDKNSFKEPPPAPPAPAAAVSPSAEKPKASTNPAKSSSFVKPKSG